MNLFIDANVLLLFYHFSSDDLDELNKLLVLIKKKQITLHLPFQIVDEIKRNRDIKIADALKGFKEKVEFPFPNMTKQYPEFDILKKGIKSFEETRQTLTKKLENDIKENKLKADLIIDKLFKNAKYIHYSDEIFNAAKKRFDLGKPPGKKNSLGDALNWEALFESVRQGEDLVVITKDGDYLSELNSDLIKPYLSEEWINRKHSSIFLYKTLVNFFKDKFPEIKLANEYEKINLIEQLAKSPNFASSHTILNQLSSCSDFSEEEINEIIQACLSNSQIIWIARDFDVQDNIRIILSGHMPFARRNDDFNRIFLETHSAIEE